MSLKIETVADGVVVHIARDAPTDMRGAAILAVLSKPPREANDPETLDAFGGWSRAFWCSQQRAELEAPAIGIPAVMAPPIALADIVALWTGVDRALGVAHALAPRLQEAEAVSNSHAPRQHRRRTLGAEIQRAIDTDDELRERLRATNALELPVLSVNAGTFDSRVVRPYLPVLHLAFALAQAFEHMKQHLGEAGCGDAGIEVPGRGLLPMSMAGTVLRDAAFQEALLDQAERLETLLPRLRKPNISFAVRIRWDDGEFRVSGKPTRPPAITASDGVLIELPGESEAEGIVLVTALLGILAAPPARAADTEWKRIGTAFARVWWDWKLAVSPDAGKRPQWLTPSHLRMPLDQAAKLVDAAERRIRDRLRAAEVLGPAVQAIENGVALPGRDGRKAWSMAAEMRRALARAEAHVSADQAQGRRAENQPRLALGAKTVENFRQEVMTPSRRVIHLAIALSFMLKAMGRELGPWAAGGLAMPVPDRMSKGGWLRLAQFPGYAAHVIRLAQSLEVSAARLPAGGPRSGEWVRLRLR